MGNERNDDGAIAKSNFHQKNGGHRQLSFLRGDQIVELQFINENLWEGLNVRTQLRGTFDPYHVEKVYSPQAGKRYSVGAINKNVNSSGDKKNYVKVKYESANSHLPVLFISGIALVVAIWYLWTVGLPSGWFFVNAKKMPLNMTELKIQFRSQEPDMWDTLRAGMMYSKSEGVQTFLFLHNSHPTAVCIIKRISDNCFSVKGKDIVNSESVVSYIKDQLLSRKCLVVYDLENLHPEGVVVLKGFCDAYEPIVPGSQFFFALDVGPQMDGEPKELARNTLESKWSHSSLTHDDFGGTLTRLTQNVLKIRFEPESPC